MPMIPWTEPTYPNVLYGGERKKKQPSWLEWDWNPPWEKEVEKLPFYGTYTQPGSERSGIASLATLGLGAAGTPALGGSLATPMELGITGTPWLSKLFPFFGSKAAPVAEKAVPSWFGKAATETGAMETAAKEAAAKWLPSEVTGTVAKTAGAKTGLPALGKAVLGWMGKHKFATFLGGLGGFGLYTNLAGRKKGETPPATTGEIPGQQAALDAINADWQAGKITKSEALKYTNQVLMSGGTYPPAETNLPTPGGTEETELENPIVIEVGGEKFWWNPMGNGGIGDWERVPPGSAGGGWTDEDYYNWQWEQQERQYEWEMKIMQEQMRLQREQQAAGAAQSMAQMYAADPYKYWAQLGTPTPEAVARLTGGAIQPGEPFGKVPLSIASSQWWGNLLPSEQEQIMGAVNWLGVNPEDYVSMYQRMIPGLGARQLEPAWAR